MRSLKRSFKGVSFRKRSQHITITVLVLLLTFSIVLVVPETSQKTRLQQTFSEKTANSNGELLWNRTYGGISTDYGHCVVQTSDEGFIITGSSSSYSIGVDLDVWLGKTNSTGDLEWNQTYGGGAHDYGYCVQQTSDGGYIIASETYSFTATDGDVWLIKTNSTGDLEWDQIYSGAQNDRGNWVVQTSDGGYIIVGSTLSFGPGFHDVWLIKTNSTGDHEWNQTYGDDASHDVAYCVLQTSDGGYIITGWTAPAVGGTQDVLLIKTNSTGDIEWSKTFGGVADDWGSSVIQASNGGYIIVGSTDSYSASTDVLLIKTDENGNHLWNQTYGGTLNEEGKSVVQTTDGGYIITGTKGIIELAYTMSIRNAIPTDILLVKTDENGNHMWNQTYGGTGSEEGNSVVQTSDGEYVVAGYTTSYGVAYQDVWLLKVASGFPVIDNPADITYEEGSTGYNITWNPEDAEPSSYTITRNDTLIDGSSWDGDPITVNVDGLSVGNYTYICTVYDTAGQAASDTVMVTVTAPEEEEEDGGFPWAGFGLALAVIGLAAVIIYQTQYAKKS